MFSFTVFYGADVTAVIGLVLLLYDHLLTFSAEVEYVWKSRWSLPKVLFLFTRYSVPLAAIVMMRGERTLYP